MTAMVIWPGATAQQMQDEVLNRMEKKFEQLDHFEKVVTFARQGYGGMTITVKGGTSKADQREAWYQARKKLDDLRLELPDGVVGPIFNDEYGDVYGLLYAVKGDGIGQAELSDIAEDIKRRLLKVPMVKKVDVLGKQAERVYVEFSHERLAALGITPLAIAESLKSQNAMLPAGSIDTAQRPRHRARQRPVHERGRHPQRADRGRRPAIKLGDFATVKRGFEDPPTYTVRHNGQQVLMLGIVDDRRRQHRRPRQGDRDAVGEIQAELPYGVELERVADQPTTVKDAIWDFERSLLEALIIVIAVSLAQPRLAHRPRRRDVGAAGARRRRDRDARDGLEPRAHLARLADHRARPAGRRRDHRHRDDGGEDGSRAGTASRRPPSPTQSTAMPRLTGALITVAGFMPIGFSQVDHRRIRGRHLLDRRHCGAVSWLVSGMFTPYLAVKMLPKDFGKHHARRPVRHAVLPQAARLDRPRHRTPLAGDRRHGGRSGARGRSV